MGGACSSGDTVSKYSPVENETGGGGGKSNGTTSSGGPATGASGGAGANGNQATMNGNTTAGGGGGGGGGPSGGNNTSPDKNNPARRSGALAIHINPDNTRYPERAGSPPPQSGHLQFRVLEGMNRNTSGDGQNAQAGAAYEPFSLPLGETVKKGDWARPTGLDQTAEKAAREEAIAASLFASCLSTADCSSLASLGELSSCLLGARLFGQQETAEFVYILERGEIHLEFATDAARNPDAPLSKYGHGGPESPKSKGSVDGGEDDDDDFPLSAGEIFHTSAPNLGTFLSPLHGRYTLAEAQASTLAAEAAEEARRAKEARDAYLAKKAAETKQKEKERSDRLKTGNDAQFRGMAASILSQMTAAVAPNGRPGGVLAISNSAMKALTHKEKPTPAKDAGEKQQPPPSTPGGGGAGALGGGGSSGGLASPLSGVGGTPGLSTPQASPSPSSAGGVDVALASPNSNMNAISQQHPRQSLALPLGSPNQRQQQHARGRSEGAPGLPPVSPHAPSATSAGAGGGMMIMPQLNGGGGSGGGGSGGGGDGTPSLPNMTPLKRSKSSPQLQPLNPSSSTGAKDSPESSHNGAESLGGLDLEGSSAMMGGLKVDITMGGGATPSILSAVGSPVHAGTGARSSPADRSAARMRKRRTVGGAGSDEFAPNGRLTSNASAGQPNHPLNSRHSMTLPHGASNANGTASGATSALGSPIGPLSAQNSRPASPSTSAIGGSATKTMMGGHGSQVGGGGTLFAPGHPRRGSGSSMTGLFGNATPNGSDPLSPIHGAQPTPMLDPNDPDAPGAGGKNEGEIAPGIVRVAILAKGQLLGLCGLLSPQQVYLTTAVVHSPGTRVWALPKHQLESFLTKGKSGGEKQVRDHLGERLLKALEQAAWLNALPPSALVALASLFHATSIPIGTVLFSSGDCTADHSALYLVLSGEVACEVADERGKPVTRTLGAGCWVGELSVVVGLCRTGTARAITDLLVRYITRRSLFRFFQSFALLPLAASASRALLSSYPPLRDEQLLEQMNMQGAFARFCLKEFSAENIEFWQTAVRLRKVILTPAGGGAYSRDQVLTEAALLYTRYISERSLVQINLKETVRAQVRAALRSGTLHSESFRPAEEEILHLMVHDNFARFKANKAYTQAREELEAPSPYPFPNKNLPDPDAEVYSSANEDGLPIPSHLTAAPALPPQPWENEFLSHCARVSLHAVFSWNPAAATSKTEEELLFASDGYVIESPESKQAGAMVTVSPGPVVRKPLMTDATTITATTTPTTTSTGSTKHQLLSSVDGSVLSVGASTTIKEGLESGGDATDGGEGEMADEFSDAASTPQQEKMDLPGAFAPRDHTDADASAVGSLGGVGVGVDGLLGGGDVVGELKASDKVVGRLSRIMANQRRQNASMFVRHAPGAEMSPQLAMMVRAAATAVQPVLSATVGAAANPFAAASTSAYAFASTPMHKQTGGAAAAGKKKKEVAISKQFKSSPFAVALAPKITKRTSVATRT